MCVHTHACMFIWLLEQRLGTLQLLKVYALYTCVSRLKHSLLIYLEDKRLQQLLSRHFFHLWKAMILESTAIFKGLRIGTYLFSLLFLNIFYKWLFLYFLVESLGFMKSHGFWNWFWIPELSQCHHLRSLVLSCPYFLIYKMIIIRPSRCTVTSECDMTIKYVCPYYT